MHKLLPDFSARLLVGRRQIDILAIEKTADIRCNVEIVKGIDFDDDIRQTAVIRSEDVKGGDRDILVVSFHSSSVIWFYS